MRLGLASALLLAAVLLAGCGLLIMAAPAVEEAMTDVAQVSGIRYYGYAGQTRYGEAYEVGVWIDPAAHRHYEVVRVKGETYRFRTREVAADLAAGATVYGPFTRRLSPEELRIRFGAANATTEAGDVQAWWYRHGTGAVYVVVLRGGAAVTAFRTTGEEMDRLLAKAPPY